MDADQYHKYHLIKMARIKDFLQQQYKKLSSCIERECREKAIEKHVQFDVPSEYFSYFNEDVVRSKREAVEERMKLTEVRTYFKRKVFQLVSTSFKVGSFEE